MLSIENLKIEPAQVTSKLQDFIRVSVELLHRNGVILGLSGGLDSTVVASLSSRALGKDRVLGLILPEKDTDLQAKEDAELVATELGIRMKLVDLTEELEQFGIYERVPIHHLPKSLREYLFPGTYKMLRALGVDAFSSFTTGSNLTGWQF